MKKYLALILLLIFSISLKSQINMGNLGTVTNGCGQNFYDSGGSGGDYGSSENFTASFCAPAGQYITFNFSQFTMGTGDQLNIYNGPNSGSPLIGAYTGSSPGQVSSTLGGCLTFVFTSNAPNVIFGIPFPSNAAGWTAAISCAATVPPPPPPPPGTCASAQPFCTSTGVTFPGSVGTTSESGPNYGCLSTQPSPGWYYLNIATSGNIDINLSNSANNDIDFAIWGPFASQAAMCAGTTSTPLDCSYSTAANELVQIPNAVAGQWYILVITNYANTPTNITAAAGNAGGVDGTTNCNILCNMTGLTATPGACDPATGLFPVTGQINLNYPPTSGVLTISSSCGPSTTVPLPWTSPISYTLPGQTANGAACNITATFSADPTCTLTTPITAPAPCNGTCTATATNTGPYCAGATIQLNSTGGGTYSWSGPGTYTSTAQNPTIASATTAMSGTYTVTVTSGTTTCTATTSVVVNPLPTPTVNSPTICEGQSATLTATGGTTYSWSTGSTVNPLTVSPTTTTPYTVTATTSGCSATAVSFVTVNPLPVPTVNSPTICAGASATLTATGGTTYSWNTGSTANPLTVSPATTTPYTVTATTAGCSATAVGTVTVNSIPVITVNSPTICPGGTASLTAAGGTTYSWNTGSTANPLSVTPGATTSYTVTGTTSGCSSTAVATVTIGASITATVNSPTICEGQTATLTATGGTTYAWNTGSTANPLTVSPITTTSYTVTATAGGCTGTAVAVVTVNPLPVPTVNSPTICEGQSATLTATDGTTYSWNTGSTTNPLTVAPSTTTSYTVTATTAGCSATAVATVTVNSLPVPTVNSPTICAGQSATLTATGGTTYLWNTGSTTNPLSVSPATTTSYTVTATTLGCTGIATATVTVNPLPVPTVNSATICAGQSATLTATDGASYSWDTGSTLNPLTVSPAATTSYTVTATTAVCSATAVATVTVNSLPVPTVNSPTICAGQSATLTATGGASYSWDIGSTSNPLTVSPSTTTSYTVTATTLGCTGIATATVTVNAAIVTTVTSVTVCPGMPATLTASGADTYSWSTGATTNPLTVTPATTTSYTVTGTSLGCMSSAVGTVTISNNLVVTAGLNDTICLGESTTISASPNGPGYTYSWSPAASLVGSTSFNPTANPTTTTTYTVSVVDPGGCTGSASVTVLVDQAIDLSNITTVPVTCTGLCNGQMTIAPTGGSGVYSNYVWSNGATTPVSSGCAGTYTVVVIDSWGCSATNSITVTEPTALSATTSNTPATCNSFCDGTATVTASGGTSPYSYSWNSVPVQTSSTAGGLCSGSYSATVTDANSCVTTVSTTISEPTVVVINPIAPLSICNSSATITASATGGNAGGYTYAWSPTGTGSTPTVVVSPTVTTTYTVVASDVAQSCVSAPLVVTVNVAPPLQVTASGTASICEGTSTVLTASASAGSGGSYTYSWSPSVTAATASVSVSPLVTTTYTVTANDGCSIPVTATVVVTALPLPVVNFAANQISGCSPVCVDFSDNSSVVGANIASWSWNFGDGASNDNTSGSQNPSHCFNSPGAYDITLTVTSSLGGCSRVYSSNDMITVYPNPVAGFTTITTSPTVLSPDIDFVSVSSADVNSWSWTFGDGDSLGYLNSEPTHVYPNENAGSYTAQLVVHNAYGCVDSTTQVIIIESIFSFYIPNAFTPNGDGDNELFFGTGVGIAKYKIMIFDRWGNKLFASDKLEEGWDGRVMGGENIVQEDVYIWKVEITDEAKSKHNYAGTVSVVK